MPASNNRVAKLRPGHEYVAMNIKKQRKISINNKPVLRTVRKYVAKFPETCLRIEIVMYINEEIVDIIGVGKTRQIVRETVRTTDEKMQSRHQAGSKRSWVWRNQKIVLEKAYMMREPSGAVREVVEETLETFHNAGEWEEWGWKPSTAEEKSLGAILSSKN